MFVLKYVFNDSGANSLVGDLFLLFLWERMHHDVMGNVIVIAYAVTVEIKRRKSYLTAT